MSQLGLGRRTTTALALTGGVVAVCIMAVWGAHALTAPVESDDASASSSPTCKAEDRQVTEFVRRSDVTVSVYNAGKKKGRAQKTMDLLERAGFKPGEVGNAPTGVSVDKAAVYADDAKDPAVRLVVAALGKDTQVLQTGEENGPGVDVVIGDKFRKLDPAAPKRLQLPAPKVTCQ